MAFTPVLQPPYRPEHVFLCSALASTAGPTEAPDEVVVAESMVQAKKTYEHFWGACAASVVCLADLQGAVDRFVRMDQYALADIVVLPHSGQHEAFCVMLDVAQGDDCAHAVKPLLVYAQGPEQAVVGALSRVEGANVLAVHAASKLHEFVEVLERGLRGDDEGAFVPVVAMHEGLPPYGCAADLYKAMGCPWYWRLMKQERRDALERAFRALPECDVARLAKLVAVGRDQFWAMTDKPGSKLELRLSATEARPGFFAHLSLDRLLDAAPQERPRVYLEAIQELQETMKERRFGWKATVMMGATAMAGGSITFIDWLSLQAGYHAMAQSFAHLALVKWGVGTFSYMAAGYAKDRLIEEASKRALGMRHLSQSQRAGVRLALLAVRVSTVVAFMHGADRMHEAFAAAQGSDGAHALGAGVAGQASGFVSPAECGPIPAHLMEQARALNIEGADISPETLHKLQDLGKELTSEMLEWVGERLERLLRLQQRTEQAGLQLFAAHHSDAHGHGRRAREASIDLLHSVPAPFGKERSFAGFLGDRVKLFRAHGLGVAEAMLSLQLKDSAADVYVRSDAITRAEMLKADPPPARYRAAAASADSVFAEGWASRRLLGLREAARECVDILRENVTVAGGGAMDWLSHIGERMASDPRERRVLAASPVDLEPIGVRHRPDGAQVVQLGRPYEPPRLKGPRG